jgi:branched-chain amino acid transport system substrate-binding protein
MSITRRHTLLAALACAAQAAAPHAVTFAQATSETQGVSTSEILIGAFGPLTGGNAWIGLSARDGLNLALTEINQNGGVNGRQLRMIFEGAQTPGESVAAAKKLVEQDRACVR